MDDRVEQMTDATALAAWDRAVHRALADGRPQRAADLSLVILRQYPQRALNYQQMVQAHWMLQRWEDGQNWGRRLLQVDPGNAPAWRAIARAAEQRGDRAGGYATWQRAFEGDPYEPETRAGLSRTSIESADVAKLNLACLATLYLYGHRWRQAIDCYRTLLRAAPRRVDFAVNLTVALWQAGERDEAYVTARRLVHDHPRLLLAWAVLDAVGDVDDKALASSPLSTIDPDGAFVRQWCNLRYPVRPATVTVSNEELALLHQFAEATGVVEPTAPSQPAA